MADLRDLARFARTAAKAVPLEANRVAGDVVMAVGRDVIQVTPVDTSAAESNWQGSVNAPARFPLPAIVAGRGGSTAAESAQEAIDHLRRALADKRPGEPFYLSNVLAYIAQLNEGSSRQAPAGFVERSVLLGRVTLRSARINLGATR